MADKTKAQLYTAWKNAEKDVIAAQAKVETYQAELIDFQCRETVARKAFVEAPGAYNPPSKVEVPANAITKKDNIPAQDPSTSSSATDFFSYDFANGWYADGFIYTVEPAAALDHQEYNNFYWNAANIPANRKVTLTATAKVNPAFKFSIEVQFTPAA